MAKTQDIGLLLLRLTFGGLMLVGHGWSKIENLTAYAKNFPDPLGISPSLSLAGVIGAEVGCALLIVVGLFTRYATIPLIFTMAVAAFIVHAGGTFFLPGENTKELAVLYGLAYLAIYLLGPGKYSLDYKWGRIR